MENEELELDLSVLDQQGETYSSVTDLSGVPVFTIEFQNRVNKEQRKQNAEEAALEEQVFVLEPEEKSEDELLTGLFQVENTQVIRGEAGEPETTDSLYPALGACAVIFALFLIFYWRRRTEKIRIQQRKLEEKKQWEH